MSTTISNSPAVPLWKQKYEQSQRRSAAARKAAETRRNNERERREFETSQENKLAWTYENTLKLEQRQELELSLIRAKAVYDRKAEEFAAAQQKLIEEAVKAAAVKYGWNNVKAATMLWGSYDAPRTVYYEEQHIILAEVLDSFLHDDENHPEFKDVDDCFGDDVPGLSFKERTETFPKKDESACEGCGKTIGEDDDWFAGHSTTGVLCPSCADAIVEAEGEVANGN
jgi:ribosomal protein S27E